MRGDLRPGADAYALGLRDAAVARQCVRRRLAVRPDALLERAAELGRVDVADDVVALVVERRVQEEAVMLEREVLVLLADAALAQGEELLALGERADGDRPFLEGNWHREVGQEGDRGRSRRRTGGRREARARDAAILTNRARRSTNCAKGRY